jgi:hypothetical protein
MLGMRGLVHVTANAPVASCVMRQLLANERTIHVRQFASLVQPVMGGSSPTMQASPFRDQFSQ